METAIEPAQNSTGIPHFSPEGTALTESERLAAAERKGICRTCGIRTHKMHFPLRKVALTNDDVYQGRCLRCSPECEIPPVILEAWIQRNPRMNSRSSLNKSNRKSGASSVVSRSSTSLTSTITRASSSKNPELQLNRNQLDGSDTAEHISHGESQSQTPNENDNNLNTASLHDGSYYRSQTPPASRKSLSSSPIPPPRKCVTESKAPKGHHRNRSKGHHTVTSSGIPPLPDILANSFHADIGPAEPEIILNALSDTDINLNGPVDADINLNGPEQPEIQPNHGPTVRAIHPLLRSEDGREIDVETIGQSPRISYNDMTDSNFLSLLHASNEDFDKAIHLSLQSSTSKDDDDFYDCQQETGEPSEEPVTEDLNSIIALTSRNVGPWLKNEHTLIYGSSPDKAAISIPTQAEDCKEVIKIVIRSMKVHKCNLTIQRNGCFVIQLWAARSTRQSCDSTIVEELASALKCNLDGPILAEYASLAFCYLLPLPCGDKTHGRTAESTVEALISCLERHGSNNTVQRQASKAIWQVFSDDKTVMTSDMIRPRQTKLIETLQNSIRQFPHDGQLLQPACGIIKVVLMAEQKKSSGLQIEEDLVEVICTAMDQHRGNLDIQRLVFGSLYYATSLRNEIKESAIYSIVDILKLHSMDSELNCFGCGILRNLSVQSKNVAVILEAGGIEAVLSSMLNHPQLAPLQCHGCRALKHLANNEKNELAVQEKGAFGAILAAIQTHLLNKELQVEAFGALANLSLRPDTRAVLVRQPGLLPSMLTAMKKHTTNTTVQQKVASVLLNVSTNETFAASFDEHGGLALLTTIISGHLEDIKIQQYIIGSLKNLTRKGMCSASLAESGAINVVIKAMKAFAGNIKLQTYAIGFLRNASSRKEEAVLIPRAKGIHGLIASMEQHLYDAALQQEGCLALMNLSRLKDIGVVVAVNGGVTSAIRAARTHEDSAKVQNAALGLLWNLSATTSSQTLIADEKGVDVILKAMIAHPNAVDVQQKACLALGNLAGHGACQAAIEHGCGMGQALQAMRDHPSDLSLQKYSCKFLGAMLRRKANVDVLAENGGLPVIRAALKTHGNSNADLQRYASKILEKAESRLR